MKLGLGYAVLGICCFAVFPVGLDVDVKIHIGLLAVIRATIYVTTV
jgi:hypothetical protein